VGRTTNSRWEFTIFNIDFSSLAREDQFPKPIDVYSIRFFRPFSAKDSVTLAINSKKIIDNNSLNFLK